MESKSGLHSQSLSEPRSESKVSKGQKRAAMAVQETSENSCRRVKMRDLQFILRSKGGRSNLGNPDVDFSSLDLDLNIKFDATSEAVDSHGIFIKEPDKPHSSDTQEMECKDDVSKSRVLDLDLNVEDVSTNRNPFHPWNKYENLKFTQDSECGSSVGPIDEKDSMSLWKEIKQNGYMSTLRGAKPMSIPKPRVRKSKTDTLKRKIELAQKEQTDRFARMAAPSGLLNGLNPGIINHVRNSKQVHSIIEALMKSERNENNPSGSNQNKPIKSGVKEFAERKHMDNMKIHGAEGLEWNRDNMFPGGRQKKSYPLLSRSFSVKSGVTRDDDAITGERPCARMSSQFNTENEDDSLALKLLSSATGLSEDHSSLSHESANQTSLHSLSVKAANVASQWLELLNQDIKGRLAALRRSRRRVRAVIQTELPLLMSREFSSNKEKDSNTAKESTINHPDIETAEAHRARWKALFEQMDKSLSEEEGHLESWLNQVKEMQLGCDEGLYKNISYPAPQSAGSTGNQIRLGEVDISEKGLAIKAAAASIYSTCNFLRSMENQPCC